MLMSAVDHYLIVRRSAGFKLRSTEYYLRDFAQFASTRDEVHVVAQTAIDWAATAANEAQRHNRLSSVVRFARFMRAENPLHEIPPDALRPHTYGTLFGLLAVTGMRAGEARRLQWQDITADGLIIRESKYRKSRLVPLHDTTWTALTAYFERRRRTAGDDPHVFISRRGSKLSHTVVTDTFHAVLRTAKIDGKTGHIRPRLMDLRHSFAVKALMACPDNRDQVSQHMVALSTYMGHARIQDTFWYFQSVPELMADIAQRCETFFCGGAS